MEPVLTRSQVETKSALIRSIKETDPMYSTTDVDQALLYATAYIDGRGPYDEAHENYSRNLELATLLLVDKFYLQMQPDTIRSLNLGLILERIGDYMVQFDPSASRASFYSRIDEHADHLLGAIGKFPKGSSRFIADHVFSGKPYPKCPDVNF